MTDELPVTWTDSRGTPYLVLAGANVIANHVAGQAALALLTGDRRDEAVAAMEDAAESGRALDDADLLDTLAALLPTGAPNA